MPTIYLTLNVITIILLVFSAGFLGFIFRSNQIKKKQLKISELRREMMYNHAQILELQKECIGLESMLRAAKTPVVPMVAAKKDHSAENRELAAMAR